LKSKENAVVLSMKASRLLKGATFLLIMATLTGVAVAQSAIEPVGQFGNKYVFVTGSMIPQRVKVKSIGTATVSPVRVIKRQTIDQSGRFTTERVLAAEDPSVRVISGHGGSGISGL
jgi:hypothetical protein